MTTVAFIVAHDRRGHPFATYVDNTSPRVVVYFSATLAHDVVHHVNGVARIGSTRDELEAVGAMLATYGRGLRDVVYALDSLLSAASQPGRWLEPYPHDRRKHYRYNHTWSSLLYRITNDLRRHHASELCESAYFYVLEGIRKFEQQWNHRGGAAAAIRLHDSVVETTRHLWLVPGPDTSRLHTGTYALTINRDYQFATLTKTGE